MDYNITHIGAPPEYRDDNCVVYDNRYEVSNRIGCLFVGTYTQCLTYVGALTMGKSPQTARNFALGTYR